MVKSGVHLLLAIAALGSGTSSLAASARQTSRYTKLTDCKIVEQGADEEDWLIHQCKGLGPIPVWIAYSDGNKAYVGFGHRRNVTGWFGIDRNEKWPIEWRGRVQGGYFKPFAVIIRMPEMDAGSGSDLVVYRLRPDGASCIVGTTKSTNDAARSIADGSMGEFTCARQPQLP